MWRRGHYLFVSTGNRRGIILGDGHSPLFFGYFSVWKYKKMRVWLGTGTPGQKGQTGGPPLTYEEDVRDEVKDTSSCFFTDLWRLNGDRGRGVPSKEYLVWVGVHDLLVTSYVSSYDVSSNPTVVKDVQRAIIIGINLMITHEYYWSIFSELIYINLIFINWYLFMCTNYRTIGLSIDKNLLSTINKNAYW